MSDITIRPARDSDSAAVARLAKLDSRSLPAAHTSGVVLAEICGEAVAAIDTRSGETVADPFRPTADVVELLKVHASLPLARPVLRRRPGFALRTA